MLRVALPNKGGLAPAAVAMLKEAGYRQRSADGDLTCLDAANDVEFFYLRPRDIATYVASGDLDLGITGRDLHIDAGADVEEILDLGFGASTFRIAARPGRFATLADLVDARIATAYPGLVARFLDEQGIKAGVIRLDGAVENAVGLGLADAIGDVVDTGATLRQVGLEPVGEPVLRSTAVLIRRNGTADGLAVNGASGVTGRGPVAQLVRRLQGVLVARQYVMIAYDVRADDLDSAVALTPGIESPTISPLRREGWVAVQAMVLRAEVHRIMDDLYDVGARAILVTDIHACRL
jgi:ATP phosphoribosyltransferase